MIVFVTGLNIVADLAKGNLIDGELSELRDLGLDGTITMLSGDDKKLFVQFVTRMLKWLPEDRATAKELLADPWLHR